MMQYDFTKDLAQLKTVGRRKIHYGGTSLGNPLMNMSIGRYPKQAATKQKYSCTVSAAPSSAEPVPSQQPAPSIENLTFYAYFYEPILEYTNKSVPYEKMRVRKCILTYFASDATVAIDEPRTKNSGYVQGKLLKRSAVCKADGSKFSMNDFYVGVDLDIYGRVYTVVDADTRTRQAYEKFGQDLSDAVEYPDDGFLAERARMDKGVPPASLGTSTPSDPSALLTAPRKCLATLKEEKNEVLRFFCAYQDDRPDGDRRSYTLHYFLSDDTVEVKEVPTEGVQRFPNLLRRSKLPRDTSMSSTPENPLTEGARAKEYVSWQDLRCGATLKVWGRPLLLLSCDRSTEAFFESRGVCQQPLQVAKDDAQAFPQTLPPFNGFGAENDLYAMGLSLQPAVINNTQEDYKRFIAADNKVLRFECSLATPEESEGSSGRRSTRSGDDPEAAGRTFVINYYLGDDTIMVYEPPVRNSGFSGGVFLARTRYKKHVPDQRSLLKRGMGSVLSRWLRPSDFYQGAEVAFEAPTTGRLLQTFKVVRADDYTRRVEREKDLAAGSRLAIVTAQLAERLCAARVQVRSNFKAVDVDNSRVLKDDVFKSVLGRMDAEAVARGNCGTFSSLDEQMLDEICWQYADKLKTKKSSTGGAYVRYDEFVDALVIAAPMPQIPELKSSSTTNVTHKSLEQLLIAPLRLQSSDSAANSGLLRKSFHEEDVNNDGTVDADSWYRVLRKHRLHGVLSRDEAEQLKQRYSEPSELSAGVEYERLCDKAFEGDFEDYMAALLMILPERGDLSSVDLNEYRKHLEGGNKIPTVKNYLDRVSGESRDCGGDVQAKLKNTICAFSSAFGRNHRKKMLRKHLMAFDVSNTGSCNRAEFAESVKRIIAEGYCELDMRDQELLFNFVFPESWTRQPFDELLALLIARDVKGIMRIHDSALSQKEDPRFLFR